VRKTFGAQNSFFFCVYIKHTHLDRERENKEECTNRPSDGNLCNIRAIYAGRYQFCAKDGAATCAKITTFATTATRRKKSGC